MNLEITAEQAQVLATLLEGAVGDLSAEIAGTENPSFRADLLDRRRALRDVAEALGRLLGAIGVVPEASDALAREMAHPGD